MDYILIGNKSDEVPTYMVSDTTYSLSDAQLNTALIHSKRQKQIVA